MSVGGHTCVKAQVQPENATNQNVSYRIVSGSDKISIEQIGQRCQITGLEIGSAVIEAMSENGGKTITCTVQILDESNIPYKHIKKEDGTKIRVDSAIRDGSGRNIETKYVRTINGIEPENGNVDVVVDVPTKVSDLENDSGFITASDLQEVNFTEIEAESISIEGKNLMEYIEEKSSKVILREW